MKSILAILGGLALALSAFGQGRVVFNNTASTNYRLWTNNITRTASNLISGVNAYRIGLYAAQGLGQPEGSLQIVGLATNIALPGYFNGGNPFALPAPFAGGDTITFQIRLWTLAAGLTWEEALIADQMNDCEVVLGTSPLGFTVITADPAPPGALFGTAPGQLNRGFESFACVPEPSSWALAGLGVVATAWLFRRRRR